MLDLGKYKVRQSFATATGLPPLLLSNADFQSLPEGVEKLRRSYLAQKIDQTLQVLLRRGQKVEPLCQYYYLKWQDMRYAPYEEFRELYQKLSFSHLLVKSYERYAMERGCFPVDTNYWRFVFCRYEEHSVYKLCRLVAERNGGRFSSLGSKDFFVIMLSSSEELDYKHVLVKLAAAMPDVADLLRQPGQLKQNTCFLGGSVGARMRVRLLEAVREYAGQLEFSSNQVVPSSLLID